MIVESRVHVWCKKEEKYSRSWIIPCLVGDFLDGGLMRRQQVILSLPVFHRLKRSKPKNSNIKTRRRKKIHNTQHHKTIFTVRRCKRDTHRHHRESLFIAALGQDAKVVVVPLNVRQPLMRKLHQRHLICRIVRHHETVIVHDARDPVGMSRGKTFDGDVGLVQRQHMNDTAQRQICHFLPKTKNNHVKRFHFSCLQCIINLFSLHTLRRSMPFVCILFNFTLVTVLLEVKSFITFTFAT